MLERPSLALSGATRGRAPERAERSILPRSLDNIAKFSSKASQCGISEPNYSRVIRRFALQSMARELVPTELVAKCLRRPIPGRSVGVLYAPASRSSHYSGLQVCASVWMCPVCAAKISERRRVELSEALKLWYAGEGVRRVLLVTLTLQHTLSDSAQDVLDSLTTARERMVSGRYARPFAERFGIVGTIRGLETTHGVEFGWHPHLHILYFFNREVPIIAFEQHIAERWSAAVASVGRYVSHQGINVQFSDADIASYVAKYGKEPRWTAAHEIAKAPAKLGREGGRTPQQLLEDCLCGDHAAGELWREYATAFKGENPLRWSPGLRAKVGLGKEKSNEELASEHEEIAVLLASLSVGAWRVIVANDARAELLEVAATGDRERVNSFLRSLGVRA